MGTCEQPGFQASLCSHRPGRLQAVRLESRLHSLGPCRRCDIGLHLYLLTLLSAEVIITKCRLWLMAVTPVAPVKARRCRKHCHLTLEIAH